MGATDLLSGVRGEAFEVDLSQPAADLAAAVERLLSHPRELRRVGAAAAVRARGWSEAANAAALTEIVRDALAQDLSDGFGLLLHGDAGPF